MTDRLRPRDLALLAAESARTPMHNATVEIFDPAESGFDYDRLLGLIADRLAFVPRYRQRLRQVPGRLANPVWVDDGDFDLAYHVRRSALPRPGSREQLRELVARIMSRRLDRNRPLWEVYFVEGVEGGRFALLSKSHHVLVDGRDTVDLGQVLLDPTAQTPDPVQDHWHPRPEPGAAALVTSAVRETAERPRTLVSTTRGNLETVVRSARAVTGRLGAVAGALANRPAAPESPLHAELSEQRRFVTLRTSLDDFRRVRDVHGGTVNDVILAAIAGALRSWLMTRAEPVSSSRALRVLVPMSVIDEELEPTSLGSQVIGHLLTLPIGEPSPVVRLHQVSYALTAHRETGKSVAANRLAGTAGFAPTTYHALAARLAAEQALRHGSQLVVTNVPGPQFPLFAAGARMVETYPVVPLQPGLALGIGVTSYDGAVCFGINADRDALPDADVLSSCLVESLEELVESTRDTGARAPRGRKKEKR